MSVLIERTVALDIKFETGLRESDSTIVISDIRSTFACFCFSTNSSHPVPVLAISCFLLPDSHCSYRVGFQFHFMN